jgi:hypothetical protein
MNEIANALPVGRVDAMCIAVSAAGGLSKESHETH